MNLFDNLFGLLILSVLLTQYCESISISRDAVRIVTNSTRHVDKDYFQNYKTTKKPRVKSNTNNWINSDSTEFPNYGHHNGYTILHNNDQGNVPLPPLVLNNSDRNSELDTTVVYSSNDYGEISFPNVLDETEENYQIDSPSSYEFDTSVSKSTEGIGEINQNDDGTDANKKVTKVKIGKYKKSKKQTTEEHFEEEYEYHVTHSS